MYTYNFLKFVVLQCLLSNILFVSILLLFIDLKPLLTVEAVVELVLLSMSNLPRLLPKSFSHSFTPIAAAGNDAQVLPVMPVICTTIIFDVT